ncbi:MAG: C4-dicarboxylate TRAP transporter substrate-binding protein [Bosea sp. (in: a-proteobacteria)]
MLAAAASLTIIAAPPASAQQTIKLTLATGVPALSPVNIEADQTFVKVVNEELAKNGNQFRIEWTVGHAGSIVRLPAIFQSVADGVVDMGVTTQALEQSKIPLMNVVFQAPFSTADHRVASRVLDETNAAVPAMRQAWDRQGVTFLTSLAFDRYILMSKTPLNSIDDFRGKKVGGIGPNLNWFRAGGAVGVVASFATVYNDMQSGVFEVMITAPMGSVATRLHEVAPYIIETGIGSMAVNIIVFNKAKWDGLPKPVQDAIRVGVERWEDAYLKRVDAGVEAAIETMVKGGATVIKWNDAERKRWADSLPPIGQDWARENQQRNPAAGQVLSTYMDLMRKNGVSFTRDWDKP